MCGDLCSECPRYIATQNNNVNELQKVAELWHKLGFRDSVVSTNEIKCSGCTKNNKCTYGINTCQHIDKINNCGECGLFPCEKINSVFERTENLDKYCKPACTKEEYNQLYKAFFMKEQILNYINKKK